MCLLRHTIPRALTYSASPPPRRFLFLEKEYLAIKDADQLAPIFGKRCARGVYQLPLMLLLQPTP